MKHENKLQELISIIYDCEYAIKAMFHIFYRLEMIAPADIRYPGDKYKDYTVTHLKLVEAAKEVMNDSSKG